MIGNYTPPSDRAKEVNFAYINQLPIKVNKEWVISTGATRGIPMQYVLRPYKGYPSFKDRFLAGKKPNIDDYIDCWHESEDGFGFTLSDFLGITTEEFTYWLDTGHYLFVPDVKPTKQLVPDDLPQEKLDEMREKLLTRIRKETIDS